MRFRFVWLGLAGAALSGCGAKPPKKVPVLAENSALQMTIAEGKLQIQVRCVDRKPIAVDRYHFDYTLEVRQASGKTFSVDFGALKAPVPTDSDWVVLRRGESCGWDVAFPETWPDVSAGDEVRYFKAVKSANLPKFVKEAAAEERLVNAVIVVN